MTKTEAIEKFFYEYRYFDFPTVTEQSAAFLTWLCLKGYKVVPIDPDEFRKG